MATNKYSEEPNWYVVHTYSGYEDKVKKDLEQIIENRELQDYIFKIVIPMEEQIEIKNGAKESKLRKVFPGYVLIKMIVTEQTWYIVRNTRGVTGFVGAGTNPIPLTPEEIRKMGFEEVEIKVNYQVGDSVEILTGPYQGQIARVENINFDKETVTVALKSFGREIRATLSFARVQKVIK